MKQRAGTIAAAAAFVGTLILASCATQTDVASTFTATMTVTGEADQASTESGECAIEGIRVAPNDQINLFGDGGAGSTRSILETKTIDRNFDGSGTCTYTAYFDAIPANQRSYNAYVDEGFAQRSFSADELKDGATYVLYGVA
ncbi:hypothetical protein JGU71_11085 [Antrihabitans sp. YC3-6]|uniref:Lipoprotein n=1 Tax=Antrihabitans stalagmiti TaxID=2799499 RepID=A0A934NQ88_9NOCA|nr:hypothetical protein [Antrihabitans stalagmiti]MBJ8339431.1 hypothetical protein [Antrihabitans stalagmiti]